jgi:RND superfamily putative drug exporter
MRETRPRRDAVEAELLGRWNWWAPRPLRRLHARFGLSDEGAEAPSGQPGVRPSVQLTTDRGGNAP